MTEAQNKSIVGLLLVFSHFGIIIMIFVFYVLGGFLFDEMTTSIALVAPMFSLYTTAIFKHFIKRKRKTKAKAELLTKEYIIISLFVPSVFVLFLGTIVVLKAYNFGLSSFEEFKIMLGVGESVFGIYIGLVLSSAFDPSQA